MEGRPTVCYSKGAIELVLDKLNIVMKNSPEVLRQDLESLTNDLKKISAGGWAMDEQVKVWVKQIKELIYDLEDWQVESEAGSNSSLGESGGAWQIEKFTCLIKEARERYVRYDLHKKSLAIDAYLVDEGHSEVSMYASSNETEVTPNDSPLLWEEKAILVGIDGPTKQLIGTHLKEEKKTLTVVSILGVGGLGKTTLAKKIYEDLKGQFDCHASVFLGPNPSMKDVLRDISCKLNLIDVTPSRNDEQLVIAHIWAFLRDKRYLISIDDIRSTWAWKVLNCCFPDSDHGSRILVTTRIKDVAESCSLCPSDVIYRMKALCVVNSRELHDSKISVPQKERLVGFEEVSDRMLKMCSGIPLAIIVTAGLLSWKSIILGKLHLQPLGQNYSTSQCIRTILDIAFADLPLHVQHCFLYLSTFPLNFIIKKDHLIRKWVAEGLVPKNDGKSLWETGESYFNELIARRLIASVSFEYSDHEIVGCTVHAVISDFIVSLAKEENFVTTAAELVCGPFPCDIIRRYSVRHGSQRDEVDTLVSSTVHMSRVRYLTVFGYGSTVPCLSTFKLIQVLDLKYTSFSYESQRHIRSLSRLRYLAHGSFYDLNLACEVEIGGLEHLETLDVSGIRKAQFSVSIYRLPKLISIIGCVLLLPASEESTCMLDWEEVSTYIQDHEQYYVLTELLAKSEQLKTLRVTDRCLKDSPQKFIRFLNRLQICMIQYLHLDLNRSVIIPAGWTPPRNLRRLVLKNYSIPRVPDNWELLINLTHLDIEVVEVGPGGIFVLGKLPNLVFLKLYSGRYYDTNGCVTVYSGFFQRLKVAWFKCPDGGLGLQLVYGTMPELQRLRLDINERKTREMYGRKFDFGIRFPSRLIEVYVTINCKGSTHEDVLDAEGAIQNQVSDHIDKPRLHLRRVEAQFTDNVVSAPSSEEFGKPNQSHVFSSR